jgi:hypothetical protein
MSDLKVILTIPITLAQKGHCVLCGHGPLMVEKQDGQPDRIRCIRCNLALELDTTKQYTRITDLPKGLSGGFNSGWMRGSDMRKYIRDLYNQKAGNAESLDNASSSIPISWPGTTAPTPAPHPKSEPVYTPHDEMPLDIYPDPQPSIAPSRIGQIPQTSQVSDPSDSEPLPRWLEVILPPTDQHGQWICPYLKLENNSNKGLAYLSPSNACYKISTPQLVSLAYQEEICLSGRSAVCPVMAAGFTGSLPSEIRGKRDPWIKIRKISKRLTSVLAFIFLLAVIGYMLVTSGAANAFLTLLPFYVPPVQAWFGVSSKPAYKPILTVTPGTIIPTQVNDNGQDLILGPEKQYTVHIVLEGETLEVLAKTYHMTPEAIKKVNPLVNYGVEPLMVLVMVPGNQDLKELVPLKVLRIDKVTSLQNFLNDYQINQTVFNSLNMISDEQIQPGEWIILPYYAKFTILPTPSPTPMPSA